MVFCDLGWRSCLGISILPLVSSIRRVNCWWSHFKADFEQEDEWQVFVGSSSSDWSVITAAEEVQRGTGPTWGSAVNKTAASWAEASGRVCFSASPCSECEVHSACCLANDWICMKLFWSTRWTLHQRTDGFLREQRHFLSFHLPLLYRTFTFHTVPTDGLTEVKQTLISPHFTVKTACGYCVGTFKICLCTKTFYNKML